MIRENQSIEFLVIEDDIYKSSTDLDDYEHDIHERKNLHDYCLL